MRHPAPFPLELPRRLIDLYTYEDDLVLDPFMGSGTTLVASVLCGRRAVGYDLDPDYVKLARSRVASAHVAWKQRQRPTQQPALFSALESADESEAAAGAIADSMSADNFVRHAVEAGRKAHDIAAELLEGFGFEILRSPAKVRGGGVQFSFLLADQAGGEWWVDIAGAFTTVRPGLLRADTLWKALGRASVLAGADPDAKLLLLTPHLPRPGSEGDRALHTLGPSAVFDVIELFGDEAAARLAGYALGAVAPQTGYWDKAEIDAAL